jgi:hypothetical protein
LYKYAVGIFILFVLNACSGTVAVHPTATANPTVTPTSTPEPECNADITPDFHDYTSWTKVNPNPIKGHETFVNIYVDDSAKDIYLSDSGETFPECAMIVKTHLVSAEDETITAVTVMVKMPAGYDPDHNDWWWGMYDKDGKVAEMSGKVAVCIACHQPVADADYVFSKKVLEEINK